MRTFPWLIVLLLFALLATTVLPRHLRAEVRPDLFLVLAVFILARVEGPEALALCWGTGLAKDLLSAGPLGLYALLYLVAGLACARLRGAFNTRQVPVYTALAFVGALATEAAAAGVLFLSGPRTGPESFRDGLATALGAGPSIGSMAFVTALVAPVAVRLLDALGGWLGTRRGRTWMMEGGGGRV